MRETFFVYWALEKSRTDVAVAEAVGACDGDHGLPRVGEVDGRSCVREVFGDLRGLVEDVVREVAVGVLKQRSSFDGHVSVLVDGEAVGDGPGLDAVGVDVEEALESDGPEEAEEVVGWIHGVGG